MPERRPLAELAQYATTAWVSGLFRIRQKHGWAAVLGQVAYPFAVDARDRAVLTHLPSGRAIGRFDTAADAKNCAGELVAEGGLVAWASFAEPGEIPDELMALGAVIERCGGEVCRGR